MVRHISKLWWLIMAWLLAILEKDFWHFNVMELFATLVILTGIIWTYFRWQKEKNRKLSLIEFPNNWTAHRNLSQNEFRLQGRIDVWLPHTTFAYSAKVFVGREKINVNFSRPERSMNPSRSEVWKINGTAPLSFVPEGVRTIEISLKVTIDGGVIKKKSGKLSVQVTSVGEPPSTPDKEDSPTE